MFDVYSEVRQVLKEYPTISDSTSGYFLPKKLPTAPKYTIVLDLDGTLIYCTREERERYDATFTVRFLFLLHLRSLLLTSTRESRWI